MTASIPDWLRQRALASPGRLALAAGSDRLSFRELDERVSGVSGWLNDLGAGRGDRIALLMRNGLPFVLLVHAAGRIGAVLVPLNTRLTSAELGWQLVDSDAKFLIHDQFHVENARAASGDLTSLRVASAESLNPVSGPGPARFELDAVHSILYTSGTTGRPKGAALTFGNHWWSAMGSALNLGLNAGDRWLAVLPLFHVGGLAILLRSAIYGNGVILHESFDPDSVNRAIDEEGVTLVSMVAIMLKRTLDARGDRPYPRSLRCILLGGGPAPKALLEDCARRGLPVAQTYGLTEAASQVATLAPEDALRKPGSAGKPLMPTEVRIDREGVEAPAGEAGEILVRGPTMTPGYVNRTGVDSRAFTEGWFHTGDLGYVDSDGDLFVLDRRDDLIISGGENVYPAEIESVLASHPAVAEAGVVGVRDARWGQAPAAFVVRLQTVGEDELRAFCEGRLARYKIPAHFRFVESLPRNAGGKLLRRALVDLWGQS